MIFKFARIILLPSAILILDKLITSTFISLFSPLHPRVQGSLTEQLFESWETLSGFIRRFDNTASLKRCPQSSLIVPRQGSAHPDPQFSGGRISSCRVATSKTPQSSSSAPRDISARIISVYWSRGHRRQLHFRFDLFRRFFVHCFFVRCFEK